MKKPPLTAAHLRILALVLMLLDHIWATVAPGSGWMHCVGRMAFPIFAFQAAQGYHHTHDFFGYCKRLALFALVSEVPFNLMLSGSPFFPARQNVMLTLLLGLLCCRAYDRRSWLLLCFWLLAGAFTLCDYGAPGLLTVLVFHVFRQEKWTQLLFLSLINGLGWGFLSIQTFAVLAWLPIALYSGEKGRGGRWLQYGSYLFYPLHMLILGLL